MKIFSIRDLKVEAYSTPFFSLNQGTATRDISVRFLENPMMKDYSEDFALYEIGDFDDQSGLISPCQPKHVSELLPLFKKE